MEQNNLSQTPATVVGQAPAPVSNVPTVNPIGTTSQAVIASADSGGKVPWMLIIIGIIVLLILAGGGYWYLKTQGPATTPTPTPAAPTSQAPAADSISGLQSELDNLTNDTTDSDFTQVDKDLASL